jgi:hypothetical protein
MRAPLAGVLASLALVAACGGGAPPPAATAPGPANASASAAEASPLAPQESTPDSPGPSASSSPAPSATASARAAPTSPPLSMEAKAETPTPSTFAPAPATHQTGCKARGALPDPACTPGAVMTKDLDIICHHGTRDRRHVGASVHEQAFTEYGYSFPQARGAFEVDHLIPLELGGDNTIENLWAEPASPNPGFHEKDLVENYLHKQVCSNAMTIDGAQKIIATDWVSVWMKMKGGGDPH